MWWEDTEAAAGTVSSRSQVPLSPHCAQLREGGQHSALPPGSHSLPAVIASSPPTACCHYPAIF